MKGRVGVLMSIASHINLTAISATSMFFYILHREIIASVGKNTATGAEKELKLYNK